MPLSLHPVAAPSPLEPQPAHEALWPLVYCRDPTLPPLAWCARIAAGDAAVQVSHGAGVETRPQGFTEGAWDGAFSAGRVAEATVVCGTGAQVEADCIRFVASTDRVCPLFSLRRDGVLFVSNSPIFAMAAAGEEPDPLYPFYSYDLLGIWRAGLHCPSGDLRTRSGVPLRVHFSVILSVDRSGAVRFEDHRLCEPPKDYASYRSLLVDSLRAVFENAADPGRGQSYLPVAAVSTGYDSTATAALARAAGCRDAYTYIDSRRPDPYQDSGRANAQSLGLDCREFDRWAYLQKGGRVEPEFAVFALSATTPMAALEEFLPGRILVSGHFGDSIWGKVRSGCCENLALTWVRSIFGVSQIEFRLRVGFLVLAPAYIGARHSRIIHGINNAEEMRPWSVGGEYDRPVPRRLAEEAGVPRDRFGVAKLASSHTHYTEASSFSPPALADYRSFVSRSQAGVSRFRYAYWRGLAASRHWLWQTFGRKERRLVSSSAWQRRLPFLLNTYPNRVPWEFAFTYQWAFDALRDRYRMPQSSAPPR